MYGWQLPVHISSPRYSFIAQWRNEWAKKCHFMSLTWQWMSKSADNKTNLAYHKRFCGTSLRSGRNKSPVKAPENLFFFLRQKQQDDTNRPSSGVVYQINCSQCDFVYYDQGVCTKLIAISAILCTMTKSKDHWRRGFSSAKTLPNFRS